MPVKLHISAGSLLDPSPSAAVVGGSVLTTQRVVDVVLKAFGVCAASQVLTNTPPRSNVSGSFSFYFATFHSP